GRLLVYNGNGSGGFTRSEFDVSGFGSGPLAVAAAPLTAGDTIDDVAVTLYGSGRILSPLTYDVTPPQVTAFVPAAGALLTAGPSQIRVRFSEAMRDAGPAGAHSVSNLAAYALYSAGANGLSEGGAGDDQAVPLASVSYDPATFEAVLTVAAS